MYRANLLLSGIYIMFFHIFPALVYIISGMFWFSLSELGRNSLMQEGEVESAIQEDRFARFLLPLGQKKQITVYQKNVTLSQKICLLEGHRHSVSYLSPLQRPY